MRELAVQERDITIKWGARTSRIVSVKLKRLKSLEVWVNKQVTPENIQEIEILRIIIKGRSLDLEVDKTKSTFRPGSIGTYKAPVFYITTPIDQFEFERLLEGEEGGRRA